MGTNQTAAPQILISDEPEREERPSDAPVPEFWIIEEAAQDAAIEDRPNPHAGERIGEAKRPGPTRRKQRQGSARAGRGQESKTGRSPRGSPRTGWWTHFL
eukprot:16439852-Heterocapsa_arctica.AAC.1